MADEQSRAPFNKPSPIPKDFDWQSLFKRDGDELETHYRHVLESLGKQKAVLAGADYIIGAVVRRRAELSRTDCTVKLENGAKESKMPKRDLR